MEFVLIILESMKRFKEAGIICKALYQVYFIELH